MTTADIRAAIDELVTEFSYCIDHGEATAVVGLFTEHGTFETPLVSLSGQAAIAEAMAQRAQAAYQTRHVISNLRLQQVTTDRIRGTVMLTLYRWTPDSPDLQPHPVALVEYDDVYERGSEGKWLFASRKALAVLPPA